MSNHLITRIGKRIRILRKKAGYKLVETAEQSGVSKGLLSKVENGRTIPSLPVLLSIIQSLEIEPEVFFKDMKFAAPQPYFHIRKKDKSPIKKEEDAEGFDYQLIIEKAFEQFTLEVSTLDLSPAASRKKITSDAYELKFILKGEVEYQIGEEIVKLRKGDTFLYDGRIPHVPFNNTEETAQMLTIYLYDKDRNTI
jgi:transcriptional regulator with XRE-family HTH domain